MLLALARPSHTSAGLSRRFCQLGVGRCWVPASVPGLQALPEAGRDAEAALWGGSDPWLESQVTAKGTKNVSVGLVE